MKKAKKLTLNRESLKLLEKGTLPTVNGGNGGEIAFTPSCIEILTYCFC